MMEDQAVGNILKIGVLGCGAIGSGVAKAIANEFSSLAVLSGVYDVLPAKALSVCTALGNPNLQQKSFEDLLKNTDLIVEAIASSDTLNLIRRIVQAKKDVLVMSVGQLLNADNLFLEAEKIGAHILIPSGAIAGIDAIKAVSRAGIREITITTRKPPRGLAGAPYIIQNKISLETITKETLIFEGTVDEAIKAFPQNINVAATVALASNAKDKMRIRLITSPDFHYNQHDIHVIGDFGQITTSTENRPCPDNPKTSYLAVLSAIEALRSFCQKRRIGT